MTIDNYFFNKKNVRFRHEYTYNIYTYIVQRVRLTTYILTLFFGLANHCPEGSQK